MICPGCKTIFGFAVPPEDHKPVEAVHCPRCGRRDDLGKFRPQVAGGDQREVERVLGLGVQKLQEQAISLRHIL